MTAHAVIGHIRDGIQRSRSRGN